MTLLVTGGSGHLGANLIRLEAEQEGCEKHFEQPIAELNPAIHEFQKLTIRKWEEHLGRARA